MDVWSYNAISISRHSSAGTKTVSQQSTLQGVPVARPLTTGRCFQQGGGLRRQKVRDKYVLTQPELRLTGGV